MSITDASPALDFAALSEVTRTGEDESGVRHTIDFQAATQLWGVGGCYIAAAMLRAVGEVSEAEQPANLSLQFLRPVVPGVAELRTRRVTRSRGAELHQTTLSQGGRDAAVGQIWSVDRQPDAPNVRSVQMPPAPHPDELRTIEDIRSGLPPRHGFFDLFEERQMHIVDAGQRRNRPPRSFRWLRVKGDRAPASPYLRAAMTIPLIDMLGLPAATNGYGQQIFTSPLPTICLSVHFYELDKAQDWLLGDGYAEAVADGLVNSRVQAWSVDGALVAQGLTQFMFRPPQASDARPA